MPAGGTKSRLKGRWGGPDSDEEIPEDAVVDVKDPGGKIWRKCRHCEHCFKKKPDKIGRVGHACTVFSQLQGCQGASRPSITEAKIYLNRRHAKCSVTDHTACLQRCARPQSGQCGCDRCTPDLPEQQGVFQNCSPGSKKLIKNINTYKLLTSSWMEQSNLIFRDRPGQSVQCQYG